MFDFEEQEAIQKELQNEMRELTLNFEDDTDWNMLMLITNFLEKKGFELSNFEMNVLKSNGKTKKTVITDKDNKNWTLISKLAVESSLEASTISQGALIALCPTDSDINEIQDAVDDFFWTIGFYGDEEDELEDDDEIDEDAKYLENVFADEKYITGEYSMIGFNCIDDQTEEDIIVAMNKLKESGNEIDKIIYRYIDDEEFINVLLEELTWDEAFAKITEYVNDAECEFNAAILSVKRNSKYSEDDLMDMING